MRRIVQGAFLVLLFALCAEVTGRTYYVAPDGTNGTYPSRGTISAPWATFQWAFDHVSAGDTVYFRGGIYYQTSPAYRTNLNGTVDNPIVFMGYPDDLASGNKPIIDGNRTSNQGGILLSVSSNIKFYGITVRNFVQINPPVGTDYDHPYGFYLYSCDNIYFENCIAHDIEYRGFWVFTGRNISYINCDAYNIIDPLSDKPGNHGDGFFLSDYTGDETCYYYLNGCRAWNCSDDGYDLCQDGLYVLENCWSFNNGHLEFGNGNGYKYGYAGSQQDTITRVFHNCIAFGNRSSGFTSAAETPPMTARPSEMYNCTSYRNGFRGGPSGYGFAIFNSGSTDEYELMRVFRNNIAYKNDLADMQVQIGGIYTHTNNSWDTDFTLTDADFVSVDSAGITAPRQVDGSFPDNECYTKFLHLAPTSVLVDAGINIGIPYNGPAPDLGAFETLTTNINIVKVTSVTVTGAEGASTIITNAGSLQLSNTVLPSNATNKSVTWSIANGTGRATISSSGLVTAVANGTVTARATANDGSGVSGTLLINISNQIVRISSITITGAGGATYITTNAGSLQLSTEILPSNATNKSVTWSIANGTGQATISSSGLVTAISNGTVTARATANDGSGIFGALIISLSNQFALANQPPAVTISSPTKSTSYIAPATIIIEAAASDPDGTIRKVEFYQGTNKLGELITPPYSFTWKQVSEGTYSITAAATDNQNLRTISGAVTVVVEKSANVVNELPIVSIKASNKNKKIKKNGNVLIEVLATDPDGTISKVELKNGDMTLAELTDPPFKYLWENIDTGTYFLSATAIDNLGAKSISNTLEFVVLDLDDFSSSILNLYPNPNNGDFSVSLNAPLPDSNNIVTIVSLYGQSVHNETWNPDEMIKQFSLSSLLPGTYILLVKSRNGIVTSNKFIKK